jgi:hypothetical protein
MLGQLWSLEVLRTWLVSMSKGMEQSQESKQALFYTEGQTYKTFRVVIYECAN